MNKNKWSLMLKLMVWINIVSILIIVSLSATTMVKMAKTTEDATAKDMDNLVAFTNLIAADYIWNVNDDLIKSLSSQLLNNPGIEQATFTDAKNKVLATIQRPDSQFAKAGPEEKLKKYRNLKRPIYYGLKKEVIGYMECDYNLDDVELIKKDFLKSTFQGTIIAQVIMCLFLYFFLKKTTRNLSIIGERLKQVSSQNQISSDSIQKISEEVSSATQEQASSIQETVTTLDEISSMVNSSVEGAQNSSSKAIESLGIANEGKGVVLEMIYSMEEIDKSNNYIMEEVKRGNDKLSTIVTVINEISQKTNVINDIVFQTKLLSFNASVEEARAGEHGKGFAVVAEEVGNLAQMSGKSSKEIADMLGNSINIVNSIIQETQSNIQSLIKEGNDKVKEGVEIADRCGKVLDKIVNNAAIVQNLMDGVATASKEQSEGIKNIATAMTQLDQTTLSNSNTAQKSFQSSKELALQSNELKDVVIELEAEIFGSKT